MEILCQTITGQLDAANRFCVDWNQLGVMAVANYQSVQLVDSYSMKVLNVIESARPSSVVRLKWSALSSSLAESSTLVKLACGDEAGFVSVWNTNEMKLLHELNLNESLGTFSSASVKINDMKWIYNLGGEYLLILFNSTKLLLWDAQRGQKLWTKTLVDPVYQFSVDPHLNGRIAFVGANFIQFMSDCFDESNKEKSLRKFFIMSGSQSSVAPDAGAASSSDINKKAMNIISSYFRSLAVDDPGSSAADAKALKHKQSQGTSLSECIQIEFHSFAKDILFLVYAKEIFIFELLINQTIGYILLDRQYSPFLQIYSCSQRDALFILHENGSVSLHVRDEQPYEHEIQISKIVANKETQLLSDESNSLVDQRYQYTVYAQSDQIRMAKNTRLFGFAVCPLTQKDFVVVLSDGRLLSFELYLKKFARINSPAENEAEEPLPAESFLFDVLSARTLETLGAKTGLDRSRLKIALKSVSNNSLPQMPYIVKMCPPVTKKNFKSWEPALAIGCSNGELFVYNLNRHVVSRRLTLHTHQINGIEWASIHSLLTWSYGNALGGGLDLAGAAGMQHSPASSSSSSSSAAAGKQAGVQLVKNEILFTDIRTGESRPVRADAGEESPIVGIKVSHLRQYMIVLFKEQPFEIWDLRTFSLIKRISKKSPVISILEWCQSDMSASAMKRSETFGARKDSTAAAAAAAAGINFETVSNTPAALPHSASKSKLSSAAQADYVKETFVCVDSNGLLYSFSLEGSQIREGGKVLPEEGLLVNLSSVAVKNDLVLFGDLDGNVNKWNVRSQTAAQMNPPVPSKRGEIRKVKFAPGKENLLLLVFSTDNVEVIEASRLEPVSSLKLTLAHAAKQNAKLRLVDCDWCLSDKIFVQYSNGYIQIYDINFKQLLYSSVKCVPSISTHRSHFIGGQGGQSAASRISQSNSAFSLSSMSLSSLLNSSAAAAASTPATPTTSTSTVGIFFGPYKELIAMKDLFYRYFSDYEALRGATDNDKLNYLLGLSDLYFAADKQARSSLVEHVRSLNRHLRYILFGFMKRFETELAAQLGDRAGDDRTRQQLTVATGFSVVFSYLNKSSFEAKFWTLFSSIVAGENRVPAIDRLNSYFVLNSFSSYLIDTNEFRLKEYKILKLYKDKRGQIDKSSMELLFSNLILCNQHELAFHMLMETEAGSEAYLSNSLKACLVASVRSGAVDANLQSSIKLVATSLIANGKLLEGIELLCLVGLVLDACRYLQDNNQWFKAAWLAKMRLAEADYVEVMKRWCDHLCLSQVNKKDYAILLLVSCKQYARALEILTETEFYELTHYFLQFCMKNGLVELRANEETSATSAPDSKESSPLLEEPVAATTTTRTSRSAKKTSPAAGNQRHVPQYIHDKIENNYIRLIKSLE